MKANARGWAILLCGAAIQILTGIPAAWGVFREPLTGQYGLSGTQSDLAFSVLIAAFGAGCALGGVLEDKKGPRPAALWGTALLILGFAAAGFVPEGKAALFCLAFSVPAGLGSAFLGPAVFGCAQKWFRSRKGLATGIIGGAVGASGAFLTTFVRGVNGRWGLRICFWALGGAVALVCIPASLLLKDPPLPPQRPELQGKAFRQPPALRPRQLIRRPAYWLAFAMVVSAAPSMLLLSPAVVQIGQDRGLSEQAAHLSIVLGSVGSAAGRLLCPLASDKLGRRRVYMAVFGVLAGLCVAFAPAQGVWVIVVYTGLAFCYSGQNALLPALSSDLFGLKGAGTNYGFLALGTGVGSLLCHAATRLWDGAALHPFLGTACALAGAGCAWALGRTARR